MKEAISSKKYTYAIGRRKSACARVKLFSGSGKITVNEKDYKIFFPYATWQQNLENPFNIVGESGKHDAEIKISGGGVAASSEACRLGVARCLVKINPEWKSMLRHAGFMTRDPRAKERKKPGLKRARRAPQWAKR